MTREKWYVAETDVKVPRLRLRDDLVISITGSVKYDTRDNDLLSIPKAEIELLDFPIDWNDDTEEQEAARKEQIFEDYELQIRDAIERVF